MEKIDAVITWVDGSEPNYQRKLKEHLSNNDTIKRQYLQANEINEKISRKKKVGKEID